MDTKLNNCFRERLIYKCSCKCYNIEAITCSFNKIKNFNSRERSFPY